ncbi:type II methionyl aminopeptidase [Candidatus Thorarchaeota archaeon]|nr:MAG: type II methionyl aminopeptidase [Candidatus Thorarchaeota archaeon]
MPERPHPQSVRAGKIAARVLQETCRNIKPGKKVISVCNEAEKRIIKLGAKPAFPCNVSIGHIAAHYTSPKSDRTVIPDFGLVKIDIGAHIDGYIADTARTVDIDGSLEGMVAATDDALEEAMTTIEPGMRVSEVGEVIERVIGAYGLRPVKELTGHNLKRFKLHAGKKIPNSKNRDSTRIEQGEYYAIEPFATSGKSIDESKNIYIFANSTSDRAVENTVTEKLRVYLRERYGPFPFASRWVGSSVEDIDIMNEFRNLLKKKAIKGYPVLVEKKGRPVSQSEHTVFISEQGAIPLTKLD